MRKGLGFRTETKIRVRSVRFASQGSGKMEQHVSHLFVILCGMIVLLAMTKEKN